MEIVHENERAPYNELEFLKFRNEPRNVMQSLYLILVISLNKWGKKRTDTNEAAEKVAKKIVNWKIFFLIHYFLFSINKKHKIYGYFYPLFCVFSSFNLIILFILAKKSALAPWIVIPFFPQALAES